MTVISVRALNFKKLRDVDINIEGKPIIVIGDTDEGKSTFLDLIRASLMITDFPEDPLTSGETNGSCEVVHEIDGMQYTVKRTFTNKKEQKSRFTVTDQNGGRHTLSNLLEKIFGKAFTNAYFDYNEFFFKQKSSETRFQYMMKAMGGDQVFENQEAITRLKKERAQIGGEVTRYGAIVSNSCINADTLEKDVEFYKEPKTTDEAVSVKTDILLKRKSIANLSTQLQVVKEGNNGFDISNESLSDINKEIDELTAKLEAAYREKELILKWQADNPADKDLELRLIEEIATAEEFNKKVEEEADKVYDDMVMEVNVYNNYRNELLNALNSYDLFVKYQAEWEEKDNEIKSLIAENKAIFSSRIPIPGMTIDDVDGKSVIMYDGREFCYENLSKGKSLRLAMEIQRALNPKGNNIVVIPEAQSLGSDLDEILAECKEHNVQALVEITERKQKFKIIFEEDFLK